LAKSDGDEYVNHRGRDHALRERLAHRHVHVRIGVALLGLMRLATDGDLAALSAYLLGQEQSGDP